MSVNVNLDCGTDEDNSWCKGRAKTFRAGDRLEETLRPSQAAKNPVWGDAYISPSGKQHFVGSCGHSHFAYEHTNARDRGYYAQEILENEEKWIHFSLAFDTPIVNSGIIPTQAQRDTLFDIMMEGNRIADAMEFGGPRDYVGIQIMSIQSFISGEDR